MAGWDTLLSPVIYHEPVAPVVPKPDNTAAELISHGTDTAVGAFLRAAQMRQQAEIDQKRMVQDAALTMRGQDITSKDADLRYQVAKENADSMEQSRKDLANWHTQSENDRKAYEAAKLAAATKQADAITDWETDQNTLNGNAYNDVKPLLRPSMAVNNPGQLVVGSVDWNAKYAAGQTGALPNLKKALDERVNSLTVPYVQGAELMTPDGQTTTAKPDDPKHKLDWYVKDPKFVNPVPASPKSVKLIDLYNQYQTDPRGVEKGLIAGGHGTIVMEDDPNKKGAKIATPKLDKWATNLVKSFGAKREDVINQVPASHMSVHKEWELKHGAGADSAPPEGDLPEGSDTTQKEIDAKRANELIAQHPENADRARDWYRRNYGEDLPPSTP